jgi:hypothetical protein
MEVNKITNRWLALTNIKGDDASKIRGNLRVSVNIIGPGDEGEELKPPENPMEDPKEVLMPPHLSTWTKQLEVQIWGGNVCAPETETGASLGIKGKSDPFVRVTFNGKRLQTKTINNNNNPVWSQCLLFQMAMPCMSDLIKVELFDEGNVPGTKNLIATAWETISKCETDPKYKDWYWITF